MRTGVAWGWIVLVFWGLVICRDECRGGGVVVIIVVFDGGERSSSAGWGRARLHQFTHPPGGAAPHPRQHADNPEHRTTPTDFAETLPPWSAVRKVILGVSWVISGGRYGDGPPPWGVMGVEDISP